ncbi:MAG: single-stranded-DNA-specific exonuclease RecJ [Candidatus Lindowbacteria bacterium]|nr:single-stranded-DNA-specific exonuclease RecJ [Candidatus Lindowbacteria bacterium]
MNSHDEKKWVVCESNERLAAHISQAVGCSPVIGQLLLNRGIETVEEALVFCDPTLERLHDPFLLKDMDTAVFRLRQAVEGREKILVFGDYDVDGITGTALLVHELHALGCQPYYYIPNRLVEGYGLNKEQVCKAHQEKVTLIITVDNGVSSHEEIKLASSLGIDVIVCDHHEPDGQLPPALAILNPKRNDSTYPFRDLSGAGVSFKLATALLGRLPERLDFASLGTIADIVPLVDENRILAKAGLKMVNGDRDPLPGLLELCKVSGLEGREINAGNVAFQLAPRINAAGRLGCGQLGVQLLLTTSQALAQRIARKLDEENRNRQAIEDEILHQALAKIECEFDPERDFSIMLHDDRWHPGVIGIVASKLVEIYHRPAILVAMGEQTGKGSARSIHKFHIYEALRRCQEHLVSFGGHKYAAGLTIECGKMEACRNSFERICREQLIQDDLRPVVRIDAKLDLSQVNGKLLDQLDMLAPHGNANPTPTFASLRVTPAGTVRVLRGDHLKFAVRQGHKMLPVIGFKMAHYEDLVANCSTIDISYTPQLNTYKGTTSIQLSLRDIRVSG